MKTKLRFFALIALALQSAVQAFEDPPGCSLASGGLGNTSQGGINFALLDGIAHVGDTVPVFSSLGMVLDACRAINATGSVWIAVDAANSIRLTNFLINVSLDPGSLLRCPVDALCRPGPYNLPITSAMVGAPVISPNGIASGIARSVRAVANGEGTVLAGVANEDLMVFRAATLTIVTPCLYAATTCEYPGTTTCYPAGAAITFTGYVTNCGDIQMTNVLVSNSRAAQLFTGTPPFLPLPPLTLNPGQAVGFSGSFQATLAETCAGSVASTTTVRGTDISAIGGPNAAVTNTFTSTCRICVNPCLKVTKNCDSVVLGSPNTVSGLVTNCGNITITHLVISDDLYGTLATIPSLASGTFQAYSVQVTNRTCGNFQNTVTAAGTTACGSPVSARTTSACIVTCGPVLMNPRITAGQFNVSFVTTPARTNTLEYTVALWPANWQPLTNFLGDGGTVTITDPVANQGRYYRVLVR